MADLFAIEFAYHAAIAQDDNAVGTFLDFVERWEMKMMLTPAAFRSAMTCNSAASL